MKILPELPEVETTTYYMDADKEEKELEKKLNELKEKRYARQEEELIKSGKASRCKKCNKFTWGKIELCNACEMKEEETKKLNQLILLMKDINLADVEFINNKIVIMKFTNEKNERQNISLCIPSSDVDDAYIKVTVINSDHHIIEC